MPYTYGHINEHFTEANFEEAVLEVLRDGLGYDYVYAPDVERDYANPLYLPVLQSALRRINPQLPDAALGETRAGRPCRWPGRSTVKRPRQHWELLLTTCRR